MFSRFSNQGTFYDLGERAVKAFEKRMESPKSGSDAPPKLTVESIDNHVYFYADVDTDRTLALIRRIREIDSQLRNEKDSRMLPKDFNMPIWLHIQSNGGDLFAGFAMADQLSKISSPIYSIVEGVCASAATLISTVCSKRFILPSGYMLIHQFSTVMWGKHRDFIDEMKLQEGLMETLVKFYLKNTKMNEEEVRKLLDHDSWFGADECLKLGLVDEIL